jgi:hypothetical protein
MEPIPDPASKRRLLSWNGQGDDLNPVVLELDAHYDIARLLQQNVGQLATARGLNCNCHLFR